MLYINKICVLAVFYDDIFVKIFAKKFGGKEKMSTFAIPNEKRGATALEFGKKSSLKRLRKSTRSKYREKYNLSRSVNSIEN